MRKRERQALQNIAPTGPVVALVGRPNVGKSTLFNLLTRGAPALTHPTAGTTRDTRRVAGRLGALTFTLLDTAGQELGAKGLGAQLNALAMDAAETADVLLLVLDGVAGVLPADRDLAQRLRKLGKPVVVVVNKADVKAAERSQTEALQLGLGEPVRVSAAHSLGLLALEAALSAHVPETEELEDIVEEYGEDAAEEGPKEDDADDLRELRQPPSPLKLVILGRPNVGKSTLANALLGRPVMLTGPEAGLTREAIGHRFAHEGQDYVLIDTPGLRKKTKVVDELEQLSGQQTLTALGEADVAILLVDASGFDPGGGRWQVFDQQDAKLAALLNDRAIPLVLGLSKMDTLSPADRQACVEEAQHQLGQRLHGLHLPLVVPFSALKRKGLQEILAGVQTLVQRHYAHFGTGVLNRALAKVLAKRSPPLADGQTVSLKFIRQTGQAPVSLTLWGNRVHLLPGFYQQFLRNQLAELLGLQGVPLKLYYRRGKNPFRH